MPTYAYRCPRCQKGISIRRPITEMDAPLDCLDCGAPVERQVVNAVNFGGFARTPAAERDYSTEYRQFMEATSENGTTLPTYQQAKAYALDLKRKGAKDANDLPSRF